MILYRQGKALKQQHWIQLFLPVELQLQGHISSSLHCSPQCPLHLSVVTGRDGGTKPEGTDLARLLLHNLKCRDVQIYRREVARHGGSSYGSCHPFLRAWGTSTHMSGLLVSFQLSLVSKKGLFKTYLLLVYLLHPPAEPAMGKDKHRHPEGSQDEGLEGQKRSATPFTKYLVSRGF